MSERKLAALRKRMEREEKEKMLRLEAQERAQMVQARYEAEEREKMEALARAKALAEAQLNAEQNANFGRMNLLNEHTIYQYYR